MSIFEIVFGMDVNNQVKLDISFVSAIMDSVHSSDDLWTSRKPQRQSIWSDQGKVRTIIIQWSVFAYHQPNKIMAYLTFHKWLVLICNIHNDMWMLQTKTSHLGKVSYAIILLVWRYNTISCSLTLVNSWQCFRTKNKLQLETDFDFW